MTAACDAGDSTPPRIWRPRCFGSSRPQIDPLTTPARDRYGLARESHRRVWPQPFAPCDEAAAAYYDPDRAAPGLAIADITASRATSACAAAVAVPGHVSRADYQSGARAARRAMSQGRALNSNSPSRTAFARHRWISRICCSTAATSRQGAAPSTCISGPRVRVWARRPCGSLSL